jgi:long-chain fatty acid transport protein
MPFDRAFRYGLGFQCGWSGDVTIGLAYEFLDAGSAEVANPGGSLAGVVRGHYEKNYIHFLAMNLVKKF